MSIFNVNLTPKDKQQCEEWLKVYSRAAAIITHSSFGELTLQKLIVYEASTRQRIYLIERLLGRYNKLRKARELKEIKIYIRGYYGEEGKQSRKVFEKEG